MANNGSSAKPRRGRGEGSIVWLEDKKMWFGRLSAGIDDNGKRVIKAFYSKKNGKKSEVSKKMTEWQRQSDTGYANISKDTLDEKIKTWLVVIKKQSLKEASYDRLESTINNHIIPVLGDYKVSELSAVIIQENLINKMLGKYSYSSIKKVYDALNAYLKYAMNTREIIFNPMASVNKPNSTHFEERKIDVLADEDIKKLITTVSVKYKTGAMKFRYGQAYILILNTGMRMGEALALKWEDVDLANKTINVSRNLIIIKNRTGIDSDTKKRKLKIQTSTKSQNGNRIIPLNKAAYSAIAYFLQQRNSDFVISTKMGGSVYPAPFQSTLDSICRDAGIKRFGIHALRHTFASKMIEAGVDIKVVSKILGHSSVKITYDIYIHVLDSQKKNAVESVDFT